MIYKETKYLKVGWPEYQTYMEHPQFRELSYYNCDNNIYFIPENLIDEIDCKLQLPRVYDNTNLGTIILTDTHAIVNEKDYWYDITQIKKGSEVLVYDINNDNWLITICETSYTKEFPIFFSDKNLLESINCEIIGVKL